MRDGVEIESNLKIAWSAREEPTARGPADVRKTPLGELTPS